MLPSADLTSRNLTIQLQDQGKHVYQSIRLDKPNAMRPSASFCPVSGRRYKQKHMQTYTTKYYREQTSLIQIYT